MGKIGKDQKTVSKEVKPVGDGQVIVGKPKTTNIKSVIDLVQLMQPDGEKFLLPSKGLVYDNKMDCVIIRSMTSREEKKIASITMKNFNQQINQVLVNCVIEPNDFDPSILTIGDKTTLITKIRVNTYGSEYITDITCPNCRETSKQTYDLNKLDDVWLPDDFSEPQIIELTDGVSVLLRLMKVRDDMEVDAMMAQQRKLKNIPAEDEWSWRYAKTIEDIMHNGNSIPSLTYKDKITFFDGLPGKESGKIRYWHNHFDHGVDLRVKFICPSCEWEGDKVALNIDASFFLPTQM